MKYLLFFTILIFYNCASKKNNFEKKETGIKIIFDQSDSIKKDKKSPKETNNLIDSLNFYFPNSEIVITDNKLEIDSILIRSESTIRIQHNWLKLFHNSSNLGIGGNEYYTFKGRMKIDIRKKLLFNRAYSLTADKNIAYQINNCYQKNAESKITEIILIEQIDVEGYQSYFTKIKEEFGEQRIIEVTFYDKGKLAMKYPTATKIYFSFSKSKILAEYVDRNTNQILRIDTLK